MELENEKSIGLEKPEKRELTEAEREIEELKATYAAYERAYRESMGLEAKPEPEATPAEPEEVLPPASSLHIKKKFRNYIPGTFEFETEEPGYVLLVPDHIKRGLNWLLLLMPMLVILVMNKEFLIFTATFVGIVIVSVLIQTFAIKFLTKKALFTVAKWGETPYSRFQEEKRKRQENRKK